MENKNKTVVKSMALLNLFLTNERLSLNEMVEISGMPKTSVYRMVGSLEEMGFLKKDEVGKYSFGLLFLQFGQLVKERLDIRRIALPVMHKLRDEVGEAVNLIIRDNDEAVYIEKVDTNHPIRIYNRPGRRVPMYAGACPRSLLAFLPEQERDEYISRVELISIGRGTITNREQLMAVLIESKANGYTISHSELENDTSAVAAPIFEHTGNVVAGISIAGPTSRFCEDNLSRLIHQVKKAAAECSARLGCNE